MIIQIQNAVAISETAMVISTKNVIIMNSIYYYKHTLNKINGPTRTKAINKIRGARFLHPLRF
jgi:hypothetical protein